MKLDYNSFWPEKEPPTPPPSSTRTAKPPPIQQQRQVAVVRDIGIRVALYGIGGWIVGFFGIILLLGLLGLLNLLLSAIF